MNRPHNPPLPGKGYIAFWALVCLASVAYAVDPMYSLREVKSEVGNSMLACFAFFVIAASPERARTLLRALAAGLAFIGGWAILAWLFNGLQWNEEGRYGGIGVFASYLVAILPALVWLAVSETHVAWRRLALGLLPFILLLAFATGQRAVWPVMFLQGMLIWYLLVRAGRLPRPRFAWGWILVFIASLAVVAMQWASHHRYHDNPVANPALSADPRLQFWPTLVQEIAKHPLTGGGFGRRALSKAYPELLPKYNQQLWHGHNLFLNYGISMGVPGILAIALLFGFWASFFWRATTGPAELAGIAGLTLVIGVLMRNQFNDFFMRDMSLLFWAQIGLFARLTLTSKGARIVQQNPA